MNAPTKSQDYPFLPASEQTVRPDRPAARTQKKLTQAPPPPHPPGCVASTGRTKIKSRYPLNKMMCQFFLMYPGIVRLVRRAVCCFDTVWAEID